LIFYFSGEEDKLEQLESLILWRLQSQR
jgi:hypothetical protein